MRGLSFRVPLTREIYYIRDLNSRIGTSFGRSKRPFNGNVLTCFQQNRVSQIGKQLVTYRGKFQFDKDFLINKIAESE